MLSSVDQGPIEIVAGSRIADVPDHERPKLRINGRELLQFVQLLPVFGQHTRNTVIPTLGESAVVAGAKLFKRGM
jgi:hypothetical protein